MGVAGGGRGFASTADAPAAAATWLSDRIVAVRDPNRVGRTVSAHYVDWFVLHVGQNFRVEVQISQDGTTWYAIFGQDITAHAAATSVGASGSQVVPAPFARIAVTNNGGAEATTFIAFVAGRVL